MADDFSVVERFDGKVWLHKDKPVWIVFYPNSTHPELGFYQAYRSVERIPKGRDPWTVDNRRIGDKDGFRTLEAAMEAACAVEKRI